MKTTRRKFFHSALACGALAASTARTRAGARDEVSLTELDRVADEPVLKVDSISSPVRIAALELLRNGKTFIARARSSDGAEGHAVANDLWFFDTYPIFVNRVAPFFVGQDARDLEPLLWELYRDRSNYKLQGLAFWVCVAAAEFAVLDLLGHLTGKSIGDLLGGVRQREIAVYRASGNRGNTPEQEIEYLQQLVAETGAKAIKFRVGGMMSKNADSLPGRTERLIPLVRETFGDQMTIYADSNSSYDARLAIQVGREMEKYQYGFFEEPCRFDHLEETKEVADALNIPIAGGEQESSMRGFRWMIYHRAVDIVQPDLHYFGGYIRSMRVARMAQAAGMLCTPHMSGAGLGYVDMLHFVSCIPNAAPFHEFKGQSGIPLVCDSSSLKCESGMIRVPSGPGLGITLDRDFLQKAKKLKTL